MERTSLINSAVISGDDFRATQPVKISVVLPTQE